MGPSQAERQQPGQQPNSLLHQAQGLSFSSAFSLSCLGLCRVLVSYIMAALCINRKSQRTARNCRVTSVQLYPKSCITVFRFICKMRVVAPIWNQQIIIYISIIYLLCYCVNTMAKFCHVVGWSKGSGSYLRFILWHEHLGNPTRGSLLPPSSYLSPFKANFYGNSKQKGSLTFMLMGLCFCLDAVNNALFEF